jgi:hypothetical protein
MERIRHSRRKRNTEMPSPHLGWTRGNRFRVLRHLGKYYVTDSAKGGTFIDGPFARESTAERAAMQWAIGRTAKSARRKTSRIQKRKNPRNLVKIYDSITRVEGTKGKTSMYPGQKFFHNFKKPYPGMYGTPDHKTLVIK